jgi:hypothetical protein
MRRPSPRISIITVAVLSFLVHQIISVPLFVYEMFRGKENLPLDIPGYLLDVLCWSFALVASQIDPLGASVPNKVLIPAWLFGGVFWSAVICMAVIAWRRSHPLPGISSDHLTNR